MLAERAWGHHTDGTHLGIFVAATAGEIHREVRAKPWFHAKSGSRNRAQFSLGSRVMIDAPSLEDLLAKPFA